MSCNSQQAVRQGKVAGELELAVTVAGEGGSTDGSPSCRVAEGDGAGAAELPLGADGRGAC